MLRSEVWDNRMIVVYIHILFRFCVIEAYLRQKELLKTAPKGEYLFRSVRFTSVGLKADQGSYHLCEGVATWASRVLGRKVTFKMITRKPAMTRIANSDIPELEAAKFMGVTVKTLRKYHTMVPDAVKRAAVVMSKMASEEVCIRFIVGDSLFVSFR